MGSGASVVEGAASGAGQTEASSVPLVSIILPSFNRLALLRETIASVFAQTIANWELVIADDGSSMETRAYLAQVTDARVKVLWLSHSGNPAVVRNAALAVARGRYIAFLDSDDTWMPAKLETQLAALRSNATCGWSYTATHSIGPSGEPVAGSARFVPHEATVLDAFLFNDVYIAMPTVLVERALVTSVGGFDERLAFAEDYDLWLRLAARSNAVAIDRPLTCVRLHPNNYCRDRVGFFRGWLALYEKVLANMTDPRSSAICRQRQAEAALHLVSAQADRRRTLEVVKTIIRFGHCAQDQPGWRRRATRALVRSFAPPVLLRLHRQFRRAGSS